MTNFGHTDRKTLDFYCQQAPVYSASGKGGVNRSLHIFLNRLRCGARILEVDEYIGGRFDGGAQGPWISIITAKP